MSSLLLNVSLRNQLLCSVFYKKHNHLKELTIIYSRNDISAAKQSLLHIELVAKDIITVTYTTGLGGRKGENPFDCTQD